MFSKKKFCAIIALALLCLACVFTASITTKNVSAEEQQTYPTEMKYDYLPCSLIRWESGFNKEISNRDIPITKRSMIFRIVSVQLYGYRSTV